MMQLKDFIDKLAKDHVEGVDVESVDDVVSAVEREFSGFFGDVYVLLWALREGLFFVTDNNELCITEKGKELLEKLEEEDKEGNE